MVEAVYRKGIVRFCWFGAATIFALLLCMTVFVGCAEKNGENPDTTAAFDPHALAMQIPEAVRTEMIDAYLEYVGLVLEKDSQQYQSMSIRAYGIFEDAYAVFMDGPFMYAQAVEPEVVNDQLLFTRGDSQKIYIYWNGQFYTLQEAHDRQIVTWEDLLVIQENYCSEYPCHRPEIP